MDIERNLNIGLLTYVETEGDKSVLTPNVIIWEQDEYPVVDVECDRDRMKKMSKRLEDAKARALKR